MSQKEEPVVIRAFRKDAYLEVALRGEIDIEAERTPIRIFTRDAYHESRIIEERIVKSADDYVKIAARRARNTLDKAAHYTGILILITITVVCIWIIVSASDKAQQIDVATKLVFLIVGAVLGRVFPNYSINKE